MLLKLIVKNNVQFSSCKLVPTAGHALRFTIQPLSFLRLFTFTLLIVLSGCNLSTFERPPRELAYEIAIEPDQSRIRISGSVNNLANGTYYFALPRTQGFPSAHFIKYVSFYDNRGKIASELTDEGEWMVTTSGPTVDFSYHINLQQSLKYEREAWGGSTTQLDDTDAFLNGSLSFLVPLVGNIAAPVQMKWVTPPEWTVVTPWSANKDSLAIPSHYALVNNYYVAYKEGSMLQQKVRHLDLNTVWLGSDNIASIPDVSSSVQRVVEAGLDFFGDDTSKEGITLILRDSNAQNRFRASTEANSIEFNFKKGVSFDKIWKEHREGFLRLLAHEIMHTWDRREVKEATSYMHIREWGPNTCWLREGFTEYFAMLNLKKAGVHDLETFLNTMQAISESAQKNNAAGSFSLINACSAFFENDNALNFIYTGGASFAFQLDLALRIETQGAKTLPALMQAYMSEHRYKEKTIDSFVAAWETYAPPSLHHMTSQLQSHNAVDLRPALSNIGLTQQASRRSRLFYWKVPNGSAFYTYFN